MDFEDKKAEDMTREETEACLKEIYDEIDDEQDSRLQELKDVIVNLAVENARNKAEITHLKSLIERLEKSIA